MVMTTETLTFIEAIQEGFSSELIFNAVESGVLEVAAYDETGLPSFYRNQLTKINTNAGPKNFRETVVKALQKRADMLVKDSNTVRLVADQLKAEENVELKRKIVPAGTIEPPSVVEFDLMESEIDAGI